MWKALASFLMGPLVLPASAAAQSVPLPQITVTAPANKAKKAATAKKKSAAPVKAETVTQTPAAEPVPSSTSSAEPSQASPPLIGTAQSGSQGTVTGDALAARQIYRTGELLEATPGLVVTQHSGEGKANQYFLRGFNLDHGTDIALFLDGMPINMRTHGHGQGYADTNFIIPELVRSLSFFKGPYFASEGDFASAGAVHLETAAPQRNFGQVEYGSFGHRRAVGAMESPLGLDGKVLAAAEVVNFDGPWDRPDDLRKLNGLLRYDNGTAENGFSLTGMAYSGKWFSTDQIPKRAVDSGLTDRFGNIDPSDGGDSQRFSLSGAWRKTEADNRTKISAYAVNSSLDLFNNFTYFLNNPDGLGDQFQQKDDRWMFGGEASKTYLSTTPLGKMEWTVGLQTRYDDIDVGLFNTFQREITSTVREDHVREFSIGTFAENTVHWTNWLRSTVGLRFDLYSAEVAGDNPANSGDDFDAIASPKAGIVFGPWPGTEFYLNAGSGFHSNDARGTVTTIDPVSGAPAQPIPFLVRSKGAEIGMRFEPQRGFSSTLSAFILDFDSEIVFVGDAGTTEASRPSRRIGAEYTLQYAFNDWLFTDVSAAYTHARFLEDDPEAPGRFIPGAVEGVVSAGVNFQNVWGGWFGGARVRYFGPRPLIEDDSARSKSSVPVSARMGYKFANGLSIRLDGFNLLDAKASQIDYYYASRLPGEAPGGVDDIHFHPLEPRSYRLSLTRQF